MVLYFASLIITMFTAIMTVLMMFSTEDSQIFKFFGETEIGICLVISVVLLLIGIVKDKR